MPKIYDQNKERSGSDTPSGGPATRMHNRGTMLALAAILAVIIIIMLYRLARGEEFQVAVSQPHVAAVSWQVQATTPYPSTTGHRPRHKASWHNSMSQSGKGP